MAQIFSLCFLENITIVSVIVTIFQCDVDAPNCFRFCKYMTSKLLEKFDADKKRKVWNSVRVTILLKTNCFIGKNY